MSPGFPTIKVPKRKISLERSEYSHGIEGKLKAKSHKGSGSLLVDHSLQAASMALTVSESIMFDESKREDLRIASFIGGLFHDLGKASAGFQEMLKNFNVKSWSKIKPGYRHEMISSVLFIVNALSQKIWKDNRLIFQAAFLAIIVHHKPFKRRNSKDNIKPIPPSQWPFQDDFELMYKELLLNKEKLQLTWNELVTKIRDDTNWGKKLIEDGWIVESLNVPEYSELKKYYTDFTYYYSIDGYKDGIIDTIKLRESYLADDLKFISYVRAAVTVGDHLSSGNYLFVPDVPDLKQYSIYDQEKTPYPFQAKLRKVSGSALLRAPTGSGKTEAAMNWLSNNQLTDSGKLVKVFFVLPYQANLNAMYKRISDWVEAPHGLIGLQHSRAAQVLFRKVEDEVHGNKDEIIKKIDIKPFHDPWSNLNPIKTVEIQPFSSFLLNSGFNRSKWTASVAKQINTAAFQLYRLTQESFYPIKVSTPHQLLGSVLQGKGWEVSVQEFEGACFVFDEIHVYDPHMMGLILGMSRLLIHQFNAKILFMSASFPTFLLDKIKQYVGQFPLYELNSADPIDNDILGKLRHKLSISDKTMTQILNSDNFDSLVKNVQSVLCICNTVATAQEIYNLLRNKGIPKEQVMLFHSRFKTEDRIDKENRLQNLVDETDLKFVVATQVVEVGLDIDFELGIIEGAPLDAIVQRLGRINRKGKNKDLTKDNVIITHPQGKSDLIYLTNITNHSIELLKSVEDQPLTEADLVTLIDKLYKEIGWTEKEQIDFDTAYGHEKYQEFFENLVPGTYSNWIDDVIVNQSTNDVLLKSDITKYKKRMNNQPLHALDLLVPMRVNKENYDYDKELNVRILKEFWKYNPEFGVYKEE